MNQPSSLPQASPSPADIQAATPIQTKTVGAKQDRSRRTEQALLDAALTLFLTRGVEAVTVGDIAAEAGVAPATIYRRFGDKEGLLKEVFAGVTTRAITMLDIAAPNALADTKQRSFVSRMADVTNLVLRYSQANQRLLQSAYAKALADDHYAALLKELRSRTMARLKEYFLLHAGEIRHPQPAVALDFALRQAMAMLTARLEATRLEVDEGAVSDEIFVRELMRSLLSYLQVPFTDQAIDKALRARGL